MNRHRVLMVVGWALVAVATAVVGTAALDIAGAGILGSGKQLLTGQDVTRQLAAAATARSSMPAAPPGGSTPTGPSGAQPTTPTPRGLPTTGGTILAQCEGDLVYLLSWSPAQGYREDGVNRGPAPAASVKFKNGKSEVVVHVTCKAGEPRAVTTPEGS
jgi:hypothetical protein